MSEKVVIGNATLYLGDCMEILPTLGKVDAVITDPPYGLGDWNNRGTNAARPFDSDSTQEWDVAPDAETMAAVLAAGKHQIVWGANYLLDHLGRTKQMLVWNKGMRKMHFNDCEMAWCSGWKAASRMFDMHPSSAEPKEHQTQKPLALMRWCISHLPNDAKTILDPFMGSGTTGVACAQLGKAFTGIERERKYFDIACERIARAQAQGQMFAPESAALPTQQAMEL